MDDLPWLMDFMDNPIEKYMDNPMNQWMRTGGTTNGIKWLIYVDIC